jgi:hypothetical protein
VVPTLSDRATSAAPSEPRISFMCMRATFGKWLPVLANRVIAGLLWLPGHFDATGCALGVAVVPHLIHGRRASRAPSRIAQRVWNGSIGSLLTRAGASRYLVGHPIFSSKRICGVMVRSKGDASWNVCGTNRSG